MIVRNGEADLPQCLESVRGIVDEIVIADTGSADASIAIAQSFGAKVIQVPWINDFAVARNTALEEASADWILVLDADEQLDAGAARQIADALLNETVDGYLVTIRNYVLSLTERLWDKPAVVNDGRLPRAQNFAGYLEHENVRLFRNRPDIRFAGRVHETVGTSIEARGGGLEHADFIIHHFGFTASAERKARKNQFYRELGRQKIQEMPGNAQAHFELGLVELDNFHNDEEALRLFGRACELKPALAVAWFFQGITLARLQRDASALPCFAHAQRLGMETPALAEAAGDAFYNCRQFAEARKAYRKALQLQESTEVLSKLGLTEVRLHQVPSGLRKLQSAINADPAAGDLHDRLIAAHLSLGDMHEAARTAENKLQASKPTQSAFLRAAALWMHAKQSERAMRIVARGLEEFSDSAEMLEALTQLRGQVLEEAHPANGAAR
jgi:tetratricopeptide (TPR) repeat protein